MVFENIDASGAHILWHNYSVMVWWLPCTVSLLTFSPFFFFLLLTLWLLCLSDFTVLSPDLWSVMGYVYFNGSFFVLLEISNWFCYSQFSFRFPRSNSLFCWFPIRKHAEVLVPGSYLPHPYLWIKLHKE